MSPRGSSSASASSSNNVRSAPTPYARRPAGQPKSSRQQFSACGACRMRRVRCDLKDLPFSTAGPHPACSNCKERGLKCVDEFADVKAVKLLRRGRRLQQVEAIYGKVVGPDGGSSSSSSPPATRLTSTIPQLKSEFFASPFWHWFSVQRTEIPSHGTYWTSLTRQLWTGPVLDPAEFPARFYAHAKGIHSLGHEGGLLAMILVVWAASFGVDERGVLEAEDGTFNAQAPATDAEVTPVATGSKNSNRGTANTASDKKAKAAAMERRRRERKERTETMLREVLELIDFHGVMRRPTWDGVRVLLLIMPLMEEAHPLERLAMYEATLSQTQALCTLATSSPGPSSSTHPFLHASDDTVVRMRIFWYAHMHEGISTGMRGGRLVLDNDDLEAFQSTLPHLTFGASASGAPSPPSPTLSTGSLSILSTHQVIHPQHVKSQSSSPTQSYLHATQLFSIPLQLSAVCRKVHSVLTGPKATRRAEEHGLIDAHGMREIWDDLDQCWQEFDTMRRNSSSDRDHFDLEQFVSAWQIYIFECHNIIRESLKQYMSNSPSGDGIAQPIFSASSPSRPSSHSSSSSPYLSPHHLHSVATRKCMSLLPAVLRILKYHLSRDEQSADGAGLFRWDAGLIRDGCFFAGVLAASVEGDTIDLSHDDRDYKHGDDGARGRLSAEECVALCIAALSEMRWAFSKTEEREEAIRMVWESKKVDRHGRYTSHRQNADYHPSSNYLDPPSSAYRKPIHMTSHVGDHNYHSMSGNNDRPLLPPLSLLHSPRRAESAPNTACSTDGHGANGWPSYTPPGTATSVTTSAGTGVSARGSPVFANLPGPMTYKGDAHDTYYHVSGDLDQFSFSAPVSGPGISDASAIGPVAAYHRNSPAHSMHSGPASNYLDPSVFGTTSSLVHSVSDVNGCQQFGEECNGFYH